MKNALLIVGAFVAAPDLELSSCAYPPSPPSPTPSPLPRGDCEITVVHSWERRAWIAACVVIARSRVRYPRAREPTAIGHATRASGSGRYVVCC